MEKFNNLGHKIIKGATIVGISALALLPGEKDKSQESNINFPEQEKIEWTRKELESNPNIEKGVSVVLIRDWLKGNINYQEKTIKEILGELHYRQLSGKVTESWNGDSDEDLAGALKSFEDAVKMNKDALNDLKSESSYKGKEVENAVLGASERIKEIIGAYDAGRQWVLDNMSSKEYSAKLLKEEEKSLPDSLRVNAKNEKDYDLDFRKKQVSDKNFILSKDIGQSYDKDSKNISQNVAAFYNRVTNDVYFRMEDDSAKAINNAIHEFAHKATKSNGFMSLSSVKLLSEAFDSLSVVAHLSGNEIGDTLENIKYFSDPTEMYARKKVFEHDLEKYKILKNGEKFTFQKYIRALELLKQNKLHYNSGQFIRSVKPKYILRVMNEIADVGDIKNENQGKDTYHYSGWDYGQNTET